MRFLTFSRPEWSSSRTRRTSAMSIVVGRRVASTAGRGSSRGTCGRPCTRPSRLHRAQALELLLATFSASFGRFALAMRSSSTSSSPWSPSSSPSSSLIALSCWRSTYSRWFLPISSLIWELMRSRILRISSWRVSRRSTLRMRSLTSIVSSSAPSRRPGRRGWRPRGRRAGRAPGSSRSASPLRAAARASAGSPAWRCRAGSSPALRTRRLPACGSSSRETRAFRYGVACVTRSMRTRTRPCRIRL